MTARDDLAKIMAASNSMNTDPNAFAFAADAVLQAGFVRVSDDSDTVERVARAIGGIRSKSGDWTPWADEAVAAIAALKGENQ